MSCFRKKTSIALALIICLMAVNCSEIITYATGNEAVTGSSAGTSTGTGTGTATGTTGTATGNTAQELAPEGSVDGFQVISSGLKADPVTQNITYTTVDKQRTTNTYYHTFGFDISDATVDANGNLVETELGKTSLGTIRIMLTSDKFCTEVPKQQIGGSVSTTQWIINYDAVLEAIKAQSPEWYARLTSDNPAQTVALKLDAVIGFHIAGQGWAMNADGSDFAYADKTNYKEYEKLYSWFKKYDDNHYNKYLIKKFVDKIAAGEITPEEAEKQMNELLKDGDTIGKTEPKYYTYNYSSSGQFDLGDAIPTSEDVRNGYQADAWWGWARVHKRSGASKSWGFGGTISWKERTDDWDYDHPNPDGTYPKTTYEYWVSKDYTYTVERSVDYWFLSSASFYDLSTVTDSNAVYPTGQHIFSSNITVDMQCTINGEDQTSGGSVTQAPDDDYHVDWANAFPSKDNTINASGDSQGDAIKAFEAEAESRIHQNDDIYVRNDLLQIYGHSYMLSSWHKHGESKNSQKGQLSWAFAYIGDDDYGFADEKQDTGQTGDNERIPSTVKNKAYYTTIQVNYAKRITPGGDYVVQKGGGGDASSYILPGYESQEPIRVHTPVVSPVIMIDPANGNQLTPGNMPEYKRTQLVDGTVDGFGDAYNEDADYQLLLDGTYAIKFIPELHTEHMGYEAAANNDGLSTSIYNKYTRRRYVAFPFTVQIDNKVYYADDTETEATNDAPGKEAGYTEWIKVYAEEGDAAGNDINTVNFYIPTWAIEGPDYIVQYMVVPENASKEDFDMYRMQPVKNVDEPAIVGDGHLYNYMATYTCEVQLSGIIYDFQIVGINDKDSFYGYRSDGKSNGYGDMTQDYPFCPTKQEKKQGNRNRIGGTSVRYTYDGTLTNSWENRDILPLSTGSSKAYAQAGYLKKGNQFAFTVRTIANLWDEEGDEMHIVPTFRWVSYDGSTVKEDINVYYTKITDKEEYLFCKYGSKQDLSSYLETSIDNTKFKGSFYAVDDSLDRHLWQQDDLEFSKDIANELLYELKHPAISTWPREVYQTAQIYAHKSAPCSTLSYIKLTSQLRLLSGNLEQLEQNLEYEGAANLKYVKDKDEHDVTYDITPSSQPETWKDFRKSMQIWFGTYWIPKTLYVTDKDVDVHEYAQEHGYVDGTEDIFYDDGYLVLNFDIYTKNNGDWHLKYYGTTDGKDQWELQGKKDTTEVGDSNLNKNIPIEVRDGDVAIIDTSKSVNDAFSVGSYITN